MDFTAQTTELYKSMNDPGQMAGGLIQSKLTPENIIQLSAGNSVYLTFLNKEVVQVDGCITFLEVMKHYWFATTKVTLRIIYSAQCLLFRELAVSVSDYSR